MRSMEIDRRTFLTAAAAAAVIPERLLAATDRGIVVTGRRRDGEFCLMALSTSGRILSSARLPDRAHGMACHPDGRSLVVMGRRPGYFAMVVALPDLRLIARIQPPDGRHFYGHAAFSPDGRTLLTTENDFERGQGMIGLWSVPHGYRRAGETTSGGVGPHDLRFDATDGTLWIANGGILTRPASGREKLNIATMAPNLVNLDPHGGAVRHRLSLSPELHQLSLRHLARSGDGDIACAAQYEGPAGDEVPLLCLFGRHGTVKTFDLPPALGQRSRRYCGDVAIDRSGELVGASFPRGGFYGFWSVADARFRGAVSSSDGCAIGADPSHSRSFALAAGNGRHGRVTVGAGGIETTWSRHPAFAFDNHLTVL